MQNLQQVQHSEGFTQFELSKQLIQSKFFSRVKLSPSARLVLVVLCSHYPNIYPSVKTIQEEAGIASKESVFAALRELSKLGFILYETKRTNNYAFTGLFFRCLDVQKMDTNKQNMNKKKNKSFKNLSEKRYDTPIKESKLPKYYSNVHITGKNYPKYKPEKRIKESPLDLDREQALQFLDNLPARMQHTYFALELKKKWNL